jgi:hypothetical protein
MGRPAGKGREEETMRMRRVAAVGALALALALGLFPVAGVTPTRAAVPTLIVETSNAYVPTGSSVTLTATLTDSDTGAPLIGQPIQLLDNDITTIASGSTGLDGTYSASWPVAFGGHQVTARWNPSFGVWTVSQPVNVVGTGASVTTLTVDTSPAVANHRVDLTVSAWNVEANQTANYGRFTVHEDGSATVLGQVTVDGQAGHIVIWGGFAEGTHHLVADFGGISGIVLASSSDPVAIIVAPDPSVEADVPSLAASSVYPVRDGYKDTIMTEGRLRERGSITIKVQNASTGAYVRTFNLGAFEDQDTPYSQAWDGRRGDGTLATAGTYRFVHVLTDTAANSVSLRSPTFALSLKRLHWTTLSSVSKHGRDFYIKGTSGTGWVRVARSSFSGGVRISGGSELAWAGVVYKAYLPNVAIPTSALIRRLSFSVHGKGIAGSGAAIALRNKHLGPYYLTNSYDALVRTASGYAWYTTATMSVAAHLSSHTVYGSVQATAGAFDIDDVRFTLKYAVLK